MLNLDLDLLLILINSMLPSDYISLNLLSCLSGLFELIFISLSSLIDELNLLAILLINLINGTIYFLFLILLVSFIIHLMILERIPLKGLTKLMMKNFLFLDDISLILNKISSMKLLIILTITTFKEFLLLSIDIEKLLSRLYLNI